MFCWVNRKIPAKVQSFSDARPTGIPFGVKNLPDLAVRSGKWKLLCEYDGSNAELYDLSIDPGESNDLVSKHPKICDQLVEQVTNWHNTMPADNGLKLSGK